MNEPKHPTRNPVAICSQLPPDVVYHKTRNSYDERLARDFPSLVLRGEQSEGFRGQWRQQIFAVSESSKLGVDLGCGYGHWLTQLAGDNPTHLYVGLDWTYKAIYHAAQKIGKRNLSNVRLLRANAGRMQLIFGHEEVDEVYLYFPDPWPREKFAHKRLLHRYYLQSLANILKPGARLWFKTDHDDFFSWGLEQFASLPLSFEVLEIIPDLHSSQHPATHGGSLYEHLFKQRGMPIKFLSAIRR